MQVHLTSGVTGIDKRGANYALSLSSGKKLLVNKRRGVTVTVGSASAGNGNLKKNLLPSLLKVVKALNTMNAMVMVQPGMVGNNGDHHLFMCGNEAGAKAKVKGLLGSFGWKPENIIDLGDMTNARGMEMILPLWVRLYGTFQSPMFQFKIVR